MPTFTGTSAAEQITGTILDDVIHGAGGDDIIAGGGGNDILYGDDGDDLLAGHDGADTLYGGAGNDGILFGGGDRAFGGDGDDYFEADFANLSGAMIDGGAGFDLVALGGGISGTTVYLDDASGSGLRILNVEAINTGNWGYTVFGGSRDDVVVAGENNSFENIFHGGGGNDLLAGQMGGDLLYGDSGDDILDPGTGSNLLDGGTGFDLVDYSRLGGSTIDLGLTVHQSTGNNYDLILNCEGVIGGEGRDIFYGGAGNDTLYGQGGDDVLQGGAGNDRLVGGLGLDIVSYSRSTAGITVSLGEGAHSVGANGTDTFEGIEGLIGSAFNDVLTGDAGDNVFTGGAGDDRIVGGDGEDTVYIEANSIAYSYDGTQVILTGEGQGRDVLTGIEILNINGFVTRVADMPINRDGTAGADVMNGSTGNDVLRGGAGNDVISGNGGPRDQLFGEDGDDRLTTGSGYDLLVGGAGDDVLNGGANGDEMVGGTGDDTYHVDYLHDEVVELAGEGVDTVISTLEGYNLRPDVENLILMGPAAVLGYGNSQNNRITGTDGDNRLGGGGGSDVLIGGLGDDWYSVLDEGSDLTTIIELAGGGLDSVLAFSSYSIVGTEVENIELHQDFGADLTGNHLNNVIIGNRRANVLNGMDGNDSISAGSGDDTLNGGAGDDTLQGGAGNDLLAGGGGAADIAVFTGLRSQYTLFTAGGVTTVTGSDDVDQLTGVERLRFDDGLFQIDGTPFLSRVDGTPNADTLMGDDDRNILTGQAGNDSLSGLAGDDTLDGGGGDDLLTGGLGDDRIDGGSGHDVLIVSGVASGYRLLMNGDDFILKGPDGGDSLTGVESIRFGDGRVLELNRMYGPEVDAGARAVGQIPEALLSGGVWDGDGPEVLPGVEDRTPAGVKGFDQPEVLPGPDGRTWFPLDRAALFDRWSGQMLRVDEQGLVGDHYVRGGGWGPDGWGF